MRRTLVLLILTVGLAGPSWAFGSRHHHSDGPDGGGQGFFSDDPQTFDQFFNGLSFNQSNGDGDHDDWDHDDPHGGKGNDTDWGNWQNDPKDDPRAAIPEPMSLALLAVGLGGLMVVKWKRA